VRKASAEIDFTKRPRAEGGPEQDCVIATCLEGQFESEPVWGHSHRSVRRALAQLSEDCPCGARFHEAANGEDKEDYDDQLF
jgi:hypothetical protein